MNPFADKATIEVSNIFKLSPQLEKLRDNISKDTYETLKKLKVINVSAMHEIERIEKKDRDKKDAGSDLDSEYWYNSDMDR